VVARPRCVCRIVLCFLRRRGTRTPSHLGREAVVIHVPRGSRTVCLSISKRRLQQEAWRNTTAYAHDSHKTEDDESEGWMNTNGNTQCGRMPPSVQEQSRRSSMTEPLARKERGRSRVLRTVAAFLLCCFCLGIPPAYALRCGNRLVSVGESQFAVVRKCGEPTATHQYVIYRAQQWRDPVITTLHTVYVPWRLRCGCTTLGWSGLCRSCPLRRAASSPLSRSGMASNGGSESALHYCQADRRSGVITEWKAAGR
jgi:hypothetical protein